MNDKGIGYRWGLLTGRRPWWIIGIWAALAIAGGVAFGSVAAILPPADPSVSGSESTRTAAAVAAGFSQFGAEVDLVVFRSDSRTVDSPEFGEFIEQTMLDLSKTPGVGLSAGPLDVGNPLGSQAVSSDRRSALGVLTLTDSSSHDRAQVAASLRNTITADAESPADVYITGFSPATLDLAATERNDTVRAEAIGLPIAAVVLLFALGTVAACAVPLLVTLIGLCGTLGVIALLLPVMNLSALVLTIVTMLGTGLGLDYSLFIVSRFREELARRSAFGESDHDAVRGAVAVAMATSGRTVVVSGCIVLVTLSALLLVPSPVFTEMVVGVSATVIMLLAASMTLAPAVLTVIGRRVERFALPPRFQPRSAEAGNVADGVPTRWGRLAQRAMRRPLLWGGAVVVALVVAALPLTGLQYGVDLGGSALDKTMSGRAGTILTEEFSPGLVGPMQILVNSDSGQALSSEQTAGASQAVTEIVDRFGGTTTSQQRDGQLLTVIVPDVAPDSADAMALVHSLRDIEVDGVDIAVAGTTAQFIDLSDVVSERFPWVVGLILAVSFLLLAAVYRSVAIPLKAVVVNALVTAAVIGVAVLVFQEGWLSQILGFTPVGFLQAYLPITVFCILFGVSMDYSIFLLDRIRESWDADRRPVGHTERTISAVTSAIDHTARSITAAAAILAVVLFSLLSADVLELKQFGLSIGLAIVLDALVIRLVLVPAAMRLLGKWNWWPGRRAGDTGNEPEGKISKDTLTSGG